MVDIDERLLDATCVENIEENFNRVMNRLDGVTDEDNGTLAALAARVTALEEATDSNDEEPSEPAGDDPSESPAE